MEKVYSVHLGHLKSNLDMPYGIYSTEFGAIAKVKEKPFMIKEPDLAGLNVTITEHVVDTEEEQVIYSWILRKNGEWTPETDDDLENCLQDIIEQAEQNGQIIHLA